MLMLISWLGVVRHLCFHAKVGNTCKWKLLCFVWSISYSFCLKLSDLRIDICFNSLTVKQLNFRNETFLFLSLLYSCNLTFINLLSVRFTDQLCLSSASFIWRCWHHQIAFALELIPVEDLVVTKPHKVIRIFFNVYNEVLTSGMYGGMKNGGRVSKLPWCPAFCNAFKTCRSSVIRESTKGVLICVELNILPVFSQMFLI